ncbi:MAG: hypothetical protein EBT07_05270 [Actinobacteria bacterium]|jgi:hypothetical protein|nr:hypothetical protein [Actinomycetota bacterium]
MGSARINIDVSAAIKNLKGVGDSMKYAADASGPAFTAAAIPLVEAAVYSDGDGLAAMASELAPVDTGALVAGLSAPNSSEGFAKNRQSQSVFSVHAQGSGNVVVIGVEYGTDPTQKGSPYGDKTGVDFLSGPAAQFMPKLQLIADALAASMATKIGEGIQAVAEGAPAYGTIRQKLSPASVQKLAKKFGADVVGTRSGRGFGYKKLSGLSRSQYLKIMRQRRYKLRKAGLA